MRTMFVVVKKNDVEILDPAYNVERLRKMKCFNLRRKRPSKGFTHNLSLFSTKRTSFKLK